MIGYKSRITYYIEYMSWHAHKTRSTRKMISLREWAELFGVKQASISWHIKKYEEKVGRYDPYDIYKILEFHRYLLRAIRDRQGLRDALAETMG